MSKIFKVWTLRKFLAEIDALLESDKSLFSCKHIAGEHTYRQDLEEFFTELDTVSCLPRFVGLQDFYLGRKVQMLDV